MDSPSQRVLSFLLSEPQHRWAHEDVITRRASLADEEHVRRVLRSLRRSGLVDVGGPPHDRRWQANELARQHDAAAWARILASVGETDMTTCEGCRQ